MSARRQIRTLRPPEVEELVGWAALEGWNPGRDDAAAFYAADPEGFLGAFVDGEMVAGISCVAYGATFGFIGLYICRREFRGQGHGKAVWDAAMARLGDRTIGLDGVVEQQDNYRRMGFVSAYTTRRYSGALGGLAHWAERDLLGRSVEVRPVTDSSFPSVLNLDAACFPEDRRGFLASWVASPRRALAFYRGGGITGFGVIRHCLDGRKIGPLFADNEVDALILMSSLSKLAEPGTVHIDVPQTDSNFGYNLESCGFTAGFETSRMYRGLPPQIDTSRIFGVTTLELG